jgi:RNA-binding protein
LQRLGLVLHMSPSRNLIVKVESAPKIGETAVDENLKPVGTIFDTFGPVSSPYVAVKPTIGDPEKLVNRALYVIPSKRRKEKVRDEWRRRT